MTRDDFKKMNRDELEQFLKEEHTEKEIIIASIELGERDIAEGNYYTTEEVLQHIFGKNSMAN